MALTRAPTYFGPHLVTPQLFYNSSLSMALVNLKPLLPGHVLVCPRRVAPRLSDLNPEELSDLFSTVQRIGRLVERVYKASSLNVAMQDGVDAGQSVPHVHMHIIPRKAADLAQRGGSDALYGMLEGEEGNVGKHQHEMWENRPKFPTVDDSSRKPRSDADMISEAEMLASELEREKL